MRFRLPLCRRNDSTGARVNGEDYRFVEGIKRAQDMRQASPVVRVLAAVHRRQHVTLFPQTKAIHNLRRSRVNSSPRPVEDIQHHVSDDMDVLRDALGGQVADRGIARAQEEIRQVVRHHTIDFLRHATIEASKSRFDVRYR